MMEHYVRNHREANQKLPHRCEVQEIVDKLVYYDLTEKVYV